MSELIDTYPILQFFTYEHLAEPLKEVSGAFCELAHTMALNLPESAETAASLRKLLEAKDCAVRSTLPELYPGERRNQALKTLAKLRMNLDIS